MVDHSESCSLIGNTIRDGYIRSRFSTANESGRSGLTIDVRVIYSNMNTKTVKISKRKVKKEGGIVILPLKEYRELLARAVPTYYLSGKEAEGIDNLVTEGLAEYRAGKTIRASSVKEALKKYGAEKNKR